MPADTDINFEGVIIDVMPGLFKIRLETGAEVIGHLSGKMKKFSIKVVLGDKVKVAMSPYDLTKARIVSRL